MPTDGQAQAINQFVAQPINNLIAFGIILALVILLAVIYVVWKFAPKLYNLFKELADTNKQNADTAAKLTIIVSQNSDQAVIAQKSLENNTAEMAKQTSAIVALTELTKVQGHDDNQYKILVSDNLHAHTESVDKLKEAIEALPGILIKAIEDKLACQSLVITIQGWHDEVMQVIASQQAKRDTGTIPVVPITEIQNS